MSRMVVLQFGMCGRPLFRTSPESVAVQLRYCLLSLLVPIGWLGTTVPAQATGTVRLELVGDAQGSAMLFQEWGQALGQAGIKNVTLRAAQEAGKVGIEALGTAENPIYVVTGRVVSRDELLLPPGRFRRGDVGRLAQWLKDLAESGPVAVKEEKAAFGLSVAQFRKVRADLTMSVGTITQGVPRQQVVEKIAARLKLPLRLEPQTLKALGDDKVAEELSGISCGTALACVLRAAGYCLVPRAAGGEISYAVVQGRPDLEVWPVGWTPEKPPNRVLPALFEPHNVNVQDVSAARALAAIGERLKTPVLIDHNALARVGIDPAKVTVNHPNSRTVYNSALQKLLVQARMHFELRCDEAGAAFLWVTPIEGR